MPKAARPPEITAFRRAVYVYRKNAEYREYEWALDADEVAALLAGDCWYCGAKPNRDVKTAQGKTIEGLKWNGIDRVDNTKGYLSGNVVSCCYICNAAKSDRGLAEFAQWIFSVHDRLSNLVDTGTTF